MRSAVIRLVNDESLQQPVAAICLHRNSFYWCNISEILKISLADIYNELQSSLYDQKELQGYWLQAFNNQSGHTHSHKHSKTRLYSCSLCSLSSSLCFHTHPIIWRWSPEALHVLKFNRFLKKKKPDCTKRIHTRTNLRVPAGAITKDEAGLTK